MKKPSFISELTIPVIAAPLFLISGPKLVIECCKNGIVGTFPALNQRTTEGFEEWVIQIKSELQTFENETGKKPAPFGVNLIVHHSNPRVQADLAICVKHKVPLIITSLGAVSTLVDAVHSYGGLVFHDIVKKRHAEKASDAGVDGLILVAAGAGGHAGTINPMPLVAEIKRFFDKTIILSGCISNGRDVASAMQMGADIAYMGTRFINTHESKASDDYKNMIISSGASDIVYTAVVSGVPASFLRPSLEKMGISEKMWGGSPTFTQKLKMYFKVLTSKISFAKELDLAKAEAKAWSTIWSAGQGVTNIQDTLSVKELVSNIKIEFKDSLTEQAKLLNKYL